MTFTKWWNKTISYQYLTNVDLVNKNTAKQLAHDAWQAAQPKWTYCKDEMPDKEGTYLWLDDDRTIHFDYFFANMPLIENVIAWMPLPEVPE